MKQITLRGIPKDAEMAFKKETTYHDLDHLFGIWTKGEAESFEEALEFQRSMARDDGQALP